MTTPPTDPTNIPDPDKISSDKSIGGQKTPTSQPDESGFQSYMQESPGKPTGAEAQGEISPMDLASKQAISTTPNYQTLLNQTNNVQDSLGEIGKNLQTPNLTLKNSQQKLLNNKLTDANANLKGANEKMGAKVPDTTQVAKNATPVTKFIGLVTDGQNKLAEATTQLRNLKSQGTDLKPGDFLLIQVKLAQAQQEIEYSTVLLSKVVDSLKQVLNIQL